MPRKIERFFPQMHISTYGIAPIRDGNDIEEQRFDLHTIESRNECINHLRKVISQIEKFNFTQWLNQKYNIEKVITLDQYNSARKEYFSSLPSLQTIVEANAFIEGDK